MKTYHIDCASASNVGQTSNLPDGSLVGMSGTVFAIGPALGEKVFYMTVPDRITGIRVESVPALQASITPGREVDVVGTLGKTTNNERVLSAGQVTAKVLHTPPDPLFPSPLLMQNKCLGGARKGNSFGCVPDSERWALNTVGMYTRVAGRVSESASGQFWVDDGSRALDGSPIRALVKAAGLQLPPNGAYVIVQGACGLTPDGTPDPTSNIATIRPALASDIIVLSAY